MAGGAGVGQTRVINCYLHTPYNLTGWADAGRLEEEMMMMSSVCSTTATTAVVVITMAGNGDIWER